MDRVLQIGNESLRRLGLPLIGDVVLDSDVKFVAYAVVAQSLDAIFLERPLNSFLIQKLDGAVQVLAGNEGKVSEGRLPELKNKSDADLWLQWLRGLSFVKEAASAIKAKRLAAPALLRFLAEVTRWQDGDNLTRVEGGMWLELGALRRSAPKAPVGWEGGVFAFVVPRLTGQGSGGGKVLFSITLPVGGDGYFALSSAPALVAHQTHLVSEDGSPRGPFVVESLSTVMNEIWPPETLESWSAFWAELDRRCEAIFNGPLHEVAPTLFGAGCPAMRVLVVDEAKVPSSRWQHVYDRLLGNSQQSDALSTVLREPRKAVRIDTQNAPRVLFLGHMDSRSGDGENRNSVLPLDQTQRLAATYGATLSAVPGENILAINGPPGTGKTSVLRACLASRWVSAALDQCAYPPVVIGTGATNKAVSNIIEAFGEVPGLNGNSLFARWIEGVPSYGWFYPSGAGAESTPQFMHLRPDWESKKAFVPMGAAEELSRVPVSHQESIYLHRARIALNLIEESSVSVPQVVEILHDRIVAAVESMRSEIVGLERGIAGISAGWQAGHALAGRYRNALSSLNAFEADKELAVQEHQSIVRALELSRLYLNYGRRYLCGWRNLLPRWIRFYLWRKFLSDLPTLAEQGRLAFEEVGANWSTIFPLLENEIRKLNSRLLLTVDRLKAIENSIEVTRALAFSLGVARASRRSLFHELVGTFKAGGKWGARGWSTRRMVAYLCGRRTDRRENAIIGLWGCLDAQHDVKYRVPLFHLSARYWEGRWVSLQLAKKGDSDQSDEQDLREKMMLGVIIVATTHKLITLCEHVPADLLIIDEAGQCAPEIAVGALSFAKSAIFVGDTKQLQPVSLLDSGGLARIASNNQLKLSDIPNAFSPDGGSGMAIAQRATAFSDGVDCAGITLLYHYRCHPIIIEYCNRLLYGGKMRSVRSSVATPFKLPPMSWVGVEGSPVREGTSWFNLQEINEIGDWLEENHRELCVSYNKPLKDIIAVITPLASQARKAKVLLEKRFGKEFLDGVVIGTVHRLQGAEKPIVFFSLVQSFPSNDTLFCDRDGGYLMNVAVSRARDAFVIFGSRATLKPTLADTGGREGWLPTPIGKLGAYLFEVGRRLYPRSLVVVEAGGKVKLIQKVLGKSVAVVATNGNLRSSHLLPNGELGWNDVSSTFRDSLKGYVGLVDDVVVATDDDIGGEMIGFHSAEICADVLGTEVNVRRMRFHSLEREALISAFRFAGSKFDGNVLSAGFFREYSRHVDVEGFKRAFPADRYISAQRRDTVAVAHRVAEADGWQVHVKAVNQEGQEVVAVLTNDASALVGPKVVSKEEADRGAGEIERVGELEYLDSVFVDQLPERYPPSTTQRILAVAAKELDLAPWDTQEHLNALYLEGVNRS